MSFKDIKDKIFQKPKDGDSGRNKKMLVLMPVLIVVFIFVVTRSLKQPAVSSASVTNPSAQKIAEKDSDVIIKWEKPDLYPSNLRDPMQQGSAVSGTDTGGDMVIKGIIFSHDRPAAVIDNKIVHQSDKVAGATIVKINRNNVEFEMNGKSWSQEVQQ